MKKFTVVKTLVLAAILAVLGSSAVGCRACCDDYPSRSYRHESLPPPGVWQQSSLTSAPADPD